MPKLLKLNTGTPWSVVAQEYKKEGLYGYEIFRINLKKKDNPNKKWIPPKKY